MNGIQMEETRNFSLVIQTSQGFLKNEISFEESNISQKNILAKLTIDQSNSVVLYSKYNLPIISKIVAQELGVEEKRVVLQNSLSTCRSKEDCASAILKLAACTRSIFVNAAAHKWNTSPIDCTITNGKITYKNGCFDFEYNELIREAKNMHIPQNPTILQQLPRTIRKKTIV